ncbi:MAG: hypothetical protein Q7S03_04315 [bacterium]|nr:hypothetical protein [bacterium]
MSRVMRENAGIDFSSGAIITFLLLFVAAVMVWFVSPMFHWLFFDIFFRSWPFCLLLAAAIIFFTIANNEYSSSGLVVLGVICSIGAVFLLMFYDGLTRQYLAQSIAPTKIESLPDTHSVRFLPYEVAKRFGDNKVQESRILLGKVTPLDENNQLDWVAPRVPNGPWNALAYQSDGFAIIRPDGNVEQVKQKMKYGEMMIVTDNIFWRLHRKNFWVEADDIYYLRVGEEVLGIASYISYEFRFPVMYPYWGGIFIVHSDGTIEDLSPKQAQDDKRFLGQRLFPMGTGGENRTFMVTPQRGSQRLVYSRRPSRSAQNRRL